MPSTPFTSFIKNSNFSIKMPYTMRIPTGKSIAFLTTNERPLIIIVRFALIKVKKSNGRNGFHNRLYPSPLTLVPLRVPPMLRPRAKVHDPMRPNDTPPSIVRKAQIEFVNIYDHPTGIALSTEI